MPEISLDHVDVIFGDQPQQALKCLDRGEDRASILERTGQVVGVHQASIDVEKGEICVLMGLSGSGKSTLLRCINRLNTPTRGHVRVNDGDLMVDVAACDKKALRHLRTRRIAMVFQQFALLPWRTVAENVGFGLELRGMPKAQRDRVVGEMVRMVGLQSWQDKCAHELSGGMQQRVGLARAFATDADILLMDEPFSALDPLIRTRLQDELLLLQQKLKKTIVFVSHDLDEAIKLGTHIAIMDEGRIVQYGAPEAIVMAPVNRYVADFVANMNPLNVLRGRSLMTRLEALPRQGNEIRLDAAGKNRVTLNDDASINHAIIAGRSTSIATWTEAKPITSIAPGSIATAPAHVTLRTALELRHQTGNPVLLTDQTTLLGVIGDGEIYRGILRQSKPAIAGKAPSSES